MNCLLHFFRPYFFRKIENMCLALTIKAQNGIILYGLLCRIELKPLLSQSSLKHYQNEIPPCLSALHKLKN